MHVEIPRGVEVLVKKAAVDPSFKKLLLERRAEAAEAIALALSPSEEAMLAAVPEAQLRAIVASTKVSPSLRPAFLGYAAAAMLAALGAAGCKANARNDDSPYPAPTGINPDIPGATEPAETAATDPAAEFGTLIGTVTDENGQPIPGVIVVVEGANRVGVTDGDGHFRIVPIPLGIYDATASKAFYHSQTRENVKIIDGVRTYLSFVLTSDPNWDGFPSEGPLIKGIQPDIPKEKGK